MQAFDVANHLNGSGHPGDAAWFYREAAGGHPYPEEPLAASLLCGIKAGEPPSESDLARLKYISASHHDFVAAAALQADGRDAVEVLRVFGNAFEAMHTGTDPDRFFLGVARAAFRADVKVAHPTPAEGRAGPPMAGHPPGRLFHYLDRLEGPLAENLARNAMLGLGEVDVYSRARAHEFIVAYYGKDAANLFDSLERQEERGDFCAAHLLYAFGGYYAEAHLHVYDRNHLRHVMAAHATTVIVTDENLAHDDVLWTEPQSPLAAAWMHVITYNALYFPSLRTDLKTGPGALTRALNRLYFRALAFGDPPPGCGCFHNGIST
jgi:hypothetical protein